MVSNSPINSWDSLGLCDCGYDDDESIDDFMNNWFGTDIDGFPQFGVDNFLDNQPSWFGENIYDPLNGALRWFGEDMAALLYGNTVGKVWPLAEQSYLLGSGIVNRNGSHILDGTRGIITSTVIPGWGSTLGANWGTNQQEYINGKLLPPPFGLFPANNKLTNASLNHDWALDRRNSSRPKIKGDAHFQWVYDAWFGPGEEPGPSGQVIRLLGTITFPIFGLLDRFENK